MNRYERKVNYEKEIKALNNRFAGNDIEVFWIEKIKGILRIDFYTNATNPIFDDEGEKITSITGIYSATDSLQDMTQAIDKSLKEDSRT